jgi:hypothetical protein
MGQRGRERAESKFSMEGFVAAYEALLSGLARGGGAFNATPQ